MTALSASEHSIIKRILGVTKTLATHGVGRTFIRINGKYHFMTDRRLRKWIKLGKQLFSPLDCMKRFSKARQLQRTSPYGEFMPKDKGYRAIQLSDIPESERAITGCREYLEQLSPKIQSLIGRQTFIHPLVEPHPDLTGLANAGIQNISHIPGLTELMLSPTMAKIASCYFGEVPTVASIVLYISLPNDTLVGSQVYHSDSEDLKQIQFVFAITDIDEECGPFTLIPADKTESFLKRQPDDITRRRITDEEVYGVLGHDAPVKLVGPSGSCWAVDTTRCLHYGSRGNKKIRCHLQVQYVSRFAAVESLLHFSKINAVLPKGLSRLQKMIISKLKFTALG